MKPRMIQNVTPRIKISPTNFFKRVLFVVRVEGESMLPKLLPSHYYLATSLKKPHVGSFIVFRNPLHEDQIFVKEVQSIENGHFFVKGTVSWATSSKELGGIPPQLVLGTLFKK